MHKASILVALVALPLGTGAAGQDVSGAAVVGQEAPKGTEALPQISSPRDRGLAEDQLGPEPRANQQIPQVANAGRTAQGPEAISKVSEGRAISMSRLDGSDRCDPAIPEKRRKQCANVIENRASEFQRPDSRELSPEQRLLLTRQIQGAGDSVVDATRRLARNGEATDSVESMGVASVVLQSDKPTAPTDTPKGITIDPQTQAIINAIITQH